MILKALYSVVLLLPLACAQSATKQPVQQSGANTQVKKDGAGAGEQNPSGSRPTFEENDSVRQNQTQNQNQPQTTDPLAMLSPELRARLTPQQIQALSAMTPEQLRAMTPDQMSALLQANGGLPGSAVGGANPNAALATQLIGQLTGLITQATNSGTATGQPGQPDDEFEGDSEYADDSEFE